MDDLPELPTGAFAKADTTDDALFYRVPRLVAHIDDRAIAAVTALYRETLPEGASLLDLMSSWISHLPPEMAFAAVAGLGLNADELAANPRLTERVVQDLNAEPTLPFASGRFGGAAICVSVQYLARPVAVLRDVARVLVAGAPLVVTFSDRCFPTKAVAIWGALGGDDRARLVALYLTRAGFAAVEARRLLARDGHGDPLWAVTGRAPAAPPA